MMHWIAESLLHIQTAIQHGMNVCLGQTTLVSCRPSKTDPLRKEDIVGPKQITFWVNWLKASTDKAKQANWNKNNEMKISLSKHYNFPRTEKKITAWFCISKHRDKPGPHNNVLSIIDKVWLIGMTGQVWLARSRWCCMCKIARFLTLHDYIFATKDFRTISLFFSGILSSSFLLICSKCRMTLQ